MYNAVQMVLSYIGVFGALIAGIGYLVNGDEPAMREAFILMTLWMIVIGLKQICDVLTNRRDQS